MDYICFFFGLFLICLSIVPAFITQEMFFFNVCVAAIPLLSMFFFGDIWTLPAIGLENQAYGFGAPMVIALVLQKLFDSEYLLPSVLSGTIATAGFFLALRLFPMGLQSIMAPLLPYILIAAIAAYYIAVYFIEEG